MRAMSYLLWSCPYPTNSISCRSEVPIISSIKLGYTKNRYEHGEIQHTHLWQSPSISYHYSCGPQNVINQLTTSNPNNIKCAFIWPQKLPINGDPSIMKSLYLSTHTRHNIVHLVFTMVGPVASSITHFICPFLTFTI